MERRTSEAAAGAFGSLYLLFLSSPVASLAAGVQTSGFAAHASCSSLYVGGCVCVCVSVVEGRVFPHLPNLSFHPSEKETKTQRPATPASMLVVPGEACASVDDSGDNDNDGDDRRAALFSSNSCRFKEFNSFSDEVTLFHVSSRYQVTMIRITHITEIRASSGQARREIKSELSTDLILPFK